MRDIFVTGGTGFIGREVVRHLVEQGHRAVVLTRDPIAARRRGPAGVAYLPGDLTDPRGLRSRLERCEAVIHLAQPETFGARISHARALRYRSERLVMDRHLLEACRDGGVRRLVYVGGTSYYGDQGTALVTEDAPPQPRGWGPFLAPAIEQLEAFSAPGLEVLEAFPGPVYGDGSWFREYVLRPLRRGAPLLSLTGPARISSPIHVEDCARAVVHLLRHGEAGRRYFVVDDRPVPLGHLSARAAEALGKPPRYIPVPAWALRVLVGKLIVESLASDCALSNARLKATGFALKFPTFAEGVPDVVARAH